MMFFSSNLLASLSITILPALILARTGNNSTILGTVQSFSAIGGVVGGAVLTAWGGPKRKVDGVLLGMILTSLFGLAGVAVGLWSFLLLLGPGLSPECNSVTGKGRVPML